MGGIFKKWKSFIEIFFRIKIIEKLLADNYAYQAGGNVYFDVSKLKDYYVLTNHKIDEKYVCSSTSLISILRILKPA